MHILLVTTGYPPEHSGSGGRLHQMYTRLAEGDPDISWSVATKNRSGKAEVLGPRRVCAFKRGQSEFPSVMEILRECLWTFRQINSGLLDDVDIVHSAGWSWMTPLLLYLARRRGIPIIRELTTPGDPGGQSIGGRLIRWTNRVADQIIAISPALAKLGRGVVGQETAIWCRPNGVDIKKFRPPSELDRKHCRRKVKEHFPALRKTDVLVLQVGRIRALKNQILLADSVALLPDRFHLLVVGPSYGKGDAYAEDLRSRLALPDISNRSAFIDGNADNVDCFMKGSDILAFPSVNEGLGTVMIEAICSGLPVVATLLPGITDWVIQEGVNGHFSDLDATSLSEALSRAVPLTGSRNQIAKDAHKLYSDRKMDEGYLTVFKALRSRS